MTANYDQAVIDHVIDLYEENGLPVALIEIALQASWLLIENIAVLPNQQGKGIGDLLLNHAENIARSLRLVELRLYTNAAFVSNIEYYKRRGFHEFAREPMEAGGELVNMNRTIKL